MLNKIIIIILFYYNYLLHLYSTYYYITIILFYIQIDICSQKSGQMMHEEMKLKQPEILVL